MNFLKVFRDTDLVVSPRNLSYFIPQFNIRVGNIERNKENIIEAILQAQQQKIEVVIFPELGLTGYPPRDFLHYQAFHDKIELALDEIIQNVESCHVILGVPLYDQKNRLRNSAIVINRTGIIYTYYKTLLPDYDVFDESRYFYANSDPGIVSINGVKIGLQICEDAWDYMWMHPIKVTQVQKAKGADLIINISASPYTTEKAQNRLDLVKNHVRTIEIPFLYVNLLGCQDDLVFDGRSFAVSASGKTVFSTPAFEVGSYILHGESLVREDEIGTYLPVSPYNDILEALKMNLNDYLEKSNLSKELLVALSGGIDSALTVAIAAEAVGPKNVYAVYMPTTFSADQSYEDSKQLCDNLGVELKVIEIEQLRQLFDRIMHNLPEVKDEWSLADENIQSRIRSNIMMYLSNTTGRILISTGNKSEIATGYCTIYGDTAGGKNLIGDLYKTEVYELARFINKTGEKIPSSIIERAPTAELRKDQKDQDSLPPYEILDQILELFVNHYKSTPEIVARGFDQDTVEFVIRLVLKNEFKRDQMVQSVKISEKAFGSGRRFPIAANFFP